MEKIELSHNDDTVSIVNKCNINFRNIWSLLDSLSKRLSRGIAPEIGSCVLSDDMPSYRGTTWQQVDTIVTDSSVRIPVWKRIA